MSLIQTVIDNYSEPLDEKAAKKLEIIAEHLKSENRKYNLTALKDDTDIALLHIVDCLNLVKHVDMANMRVIDIGCGGGFPTLVIAAAVPTARVCGMDSTAKKLGFVAECGTLASLDNLTVKHARAEELTADERESYDIAVSRGVSRLCMLAELCLPYVKVGGLFVAMKAATAAEELAECDIALKKLGGKYIETIATPVGTSGESHCLVVIGKTSPTPSKYPRKYAQIKASPLKNG